MRSGGSGGGSRGWSGCGTQMMIELLLNFLNFVLGSPFNDRFPDATTCIDEPIVDLSQRET